MLSSLPGTPFKGGAPQPDSLASQLTPVALAETAV